MKRVLIIVLILISIYFMLKPKSVINKEASPVKLMGISWEKDTPVAIINGKVLKEGDTIEGYKVIKIQKGSVFLSHRNREFRLTFSGLFSTHNIKNTIKTWVKDTVERWFKKRKE